MIIPITRGPAPDCDAHSSISPGSAWLTLRTSTSRNFPECEKDQLERVLMLRWPGAGPPLSSA